MITTYEKLLESLVQAQVKFALVGGLAVCLNGFVRTTDDVDILIDHSPENVARLTRCLSDFGEGFGKDLTPADFSNEPGAIRICEDFVLDIFVQMNGKTLDAYSPWLGYYSLKSGTPIPFLKAAGLIETKRGSSREKDRVDIAVMTDLSRNTTENQAVPPGFTLDSVRTPVDPED